MPTGLVDTPMLSAVKKPRAVLVLAPPPFSCPARARAPFGGHIGEVASDGGPDTGQGPPLHQPKAMIAQMSVRKAVAQVARRAIILGSDGGGNKNLGPAVVAISPRPCAGGRR